MAIVYSNSTTEVYGHIRDYLMNDSVHDTSNMTSSYSISGIEMLEFILFTVVGGPLCVVGFIANIICYNVLKRDSGKKHRVATFLLQALAVADNLVLILCFFNLSINDDLLPILGARENAVSKVIKVYIIAYVSPIVGMASKVAVWITVLIAINRYIAVCWPLDAQILASLRKTKIQVAVVFIMAIIFSLPGFFQHTIVYPEDNSMTAPVVQFTTHLGPDTLYGMVYIVVNYVIIELILPLVLLIILNTKIMWALRKSDKNRDVIQQSRRSENNITMVMVVIIIMFIVCNIPFNIHVVAWFAGHKYSLWRYRLLCVSELLMIVNSSTNFVVYYVLRRSFRSAFRKALCQPQALVV